MTPRKVGTSVSVVIPCLNEAAHILDVLDALRTQDRRVDEVIVVDNGSTDGTQALVASYAQQHLDLAVRLVTCERPGPAAAMNTGIGLARGDVIFRLDGHSVPSCEYVRRALAALEETGAGVVGGVWDIRPSRHTATGVAIAYAAGHVLGSGGAAYRTPGGRRGRRETDTVPYGCFRRGLWKELGGYAEHLHTNEDYAFNYLARATGHRVILDPAIKSTYFPRSSFTALATQYVRYGWWKAQMLKSFPGSLRMRQSIPVLFVLVVFLLLAAGFVWPAAWRLLMLVVGVYALVLLAAAVPMAWRHRHIAVAFTGMIALAIIHCAWGTGFLVNIVSFGRWPRAAQRSAVASAAFEVERT